MLGLCCVVVELCCVFIGVCMFIVFCCVMWLCCVVLCLSMYVLFRVALCRVGISLYCLICIMSKGVDVFCDACSVVGVLVLV